MPRNHKICKPNPNYNPRGPNPDLRKFIVSSCQFTAAENTRRDSEEAAHRHKTALGVECARRVQILVPGWNTPELLRKAQTQRNALDLLGTPAHKKAVECINFPKKCLKRMRRMSAAEVDAIDITANDPFGDGTGWPR
tara:strand:+ start:586 stop:999 length:414 start_codon:yes stop_codon:yes gene_type:complete